MWIAVSECLSLIALQALLQVQRTREVTYSTTEVGSFVGSSRSPLRAGLLSPARRDLALPAIFTEAL